MALPNEPQPAVPAIGAMLQDLGARIRSLRKERDLTLERLGELSGLSVGIVSQIERGRGNPSFATLVQLAHGLDIPVGRLLYVSDQTRSPVVRRGERRRLDGHGLGYDDGGLYELLTPDFSGALEVVWVETPPGYDTSATPYKHNGEEFGLVIEGRVVVHLDGVPHELGPGDSIRYDSTVPHWYSNPGPDVHRAVWVITPPTW
ncbi:cupin domain-containing protein [Geodermatophilus sp. YIM 151500]|uniref:helix-turn-helix domain-containing protein n=1 Tax=Geodermatophilus sp. YIM 151500 TaxID=2984531 RepID=UPI0021E3AAAD|nr:cupin domain-containing protein [Geodermatophilus sp. YIM 151500]MCV2488279.1 cupin domain-containing protein [Geodermatophilus sp. YIM 151500]